MDGKLCPVGPQGEIGEGVPRARPEVGSLRLSSIPGQDLQNPEAGVPTPQKALRL